jgi:hypothetical protein
MSLSRQSPVTEVTQSQGRLIGALAHDGGRFGGRYTFRGEIEWQARAGSKGRGKPPFDIALKQIPKPRAEARSQKQSNPRAEDDTILLSFVLLLLWNVHQEAPPHHHHHHVVSCTSVLPRPSGILSRTISQFQPRHFERIRRGLHCTQYSIICHCECCQ